MSQSQIEVTGEGSVSVAPNRAIAVLGTITEDSSLSKAQSDNNSITTNVIEALQKLSIPKEHIQTVDYRIDMQYTFEDGKQHFKGYQVTHQLQVTIEPIEKTGIAVDAAVNNGANSISSIQFITTHAPFFYNQALTLAIHNAESKAATIANTLKVKLNPFPIRIEEVSQSHVPVPFSASFAAEAKVTPIQPGSLKVIASVKAQYTFSE